MRGHLIFKFKAVFKPLDTTATGAVLNGGYDDDFREPIKVADGTQDGADSRREGAEVIIPCQVDRNVWEPESRAAGGEVSSGEYHVTLHYRHLERMGLVNTDTGFPTCPKKGDRLDRIMDKRGINTVHKFVGADQLFVTEVQPDSFGLNRLGTPKRNLLKVTLSQRRTGR